MKKFSARDLRNYIKYGDQKQIVSGEHIVGAPHKMLNIRTLTGSIPLDSDGCWDDVFEYVFGNPSGIGWERFGVGYFDPDNTYGSVRGYQGAIYIPPGVYQIKRRPLNMSGKNVFGAGHLHAYNRTVIKIHDSVSGSWESVAYCSTQPSKVQGLAFDANHKAKYGFYAIKQSGYGTHFEGIEANNTKSHAVLFDRCQASTMQRIQGATSAINGSGSGVVFSGCNASRATQIQSTSNKNHWGVQVLGGNHLVNPAGGFSGGLHLSSVRVERALSGGILAAGLGTTVIQDGWIETVYGHGIKCADSRGVTIERCRITAVDLTTVPEGQSRAIYHSNAVACTVRNVGVEAPNSGEYESEKFERTTNSEVSYVDNYNLWGKAGSTDGFGSVAIVSSSS
jgi:hypothetical protein